MQEDIPHLPFTRSVTLGKPHNCVKPQFCHLQRKNGGIFIVRVKLYRRPGNREGSRGKQATSGSSVQGSMRYFTPRVGRKINCVSSEERISSRSTLLSRCLFHTKHLLPQGVLPFLPFPSTRCPRHAVDRFS